MYWDHEPSISRVVSLPPDNRTTQATPTTTRPLPLHVDINASTKKTGWLLLSGLEAFFISPLPPPAALCSSSLMDPRYYHGSYHSSHGDHDFSGFYADHHPYDQYPYDPTYQATAMLSTQNPTTLWDIKYNLRQLPAPNPTTSSFNTMSSCVSEGNYSIVRSQTTGIYPAPPQVSPDVVPIVEVLACVSAYPPSRHGKGQTGLLSRHLERKWRRDGSSNSRLPYPAKVGAPTDVQTRATTGRARRSPGNRVFCPRREGNSPL